MKSSWAYKSLEIADKYLHVTPLLVLLLLLLHLPYLDFSPPLRAYHCMNKQFSHVHLCPVACCLSFCPPLHSPPSAFSVDPSQRTDTLGLTALCNTVQSREHREHPRQLRANPGSPPESACSNLEIWRDQTGRARASHSSHKLEKLIIFAILYNGCFSLGFWILDTSTPCILWCIKSL